MTAFDYVAFGAMAVVFGAVVFLVIVIGDLPGKVARERSHPQPEAVTAMGWFGLLFTGGIVWIIAIIWAFYDYSKAGGGSPPTLQAEVAELRERLAALETDRAQLEDAS